MSKLTLSVDDAVISRAKRYAKAHGVSISKMVETYLATVAEPVGPAQRNTPVLRALRGVLTKADLQDHKRHLAAKHR